MTKSAITAFFSVLFYSTTLWAGEGCTVQAIEGFPTVVREGQKLEIRPGDALKKGDLLEVDADGRLDMSMNDLAGCRILGGSKAEVVGWKLENMAMKIESGNLIVNLKKLPDNAAFKVETPTAIAAVRGTQFWGRVNHPTPENPVTTFAVREGAVDISVKSAGQTFKLESGKALDIQTGATAPVVRDALPEEMQAMDQAPSIPTGT